MTGRSITITDSLSDVQRERLCRASQYESAMFICVPRRRGPLERDSSRAAIRRHSRNAGVNSVSSFSEYSIVVSCPM